MNNKSVLCKLSASIVLLGIGGLLSACGGGGSNSGANTNAPTLALFAGNMGGAGTADGTGSAARFDYPWSVATDSAGNVYVADSNNNTIRKITSAGGVTTLAGTAGVTGSNDGIGAAASFDMPSGIAADSNGNLYVADSNNNAIRKIVISTGAVSTLAGGFNNPTGVATDGTYVYVADSSSNTIRKIVISTGVVSTLAGTGAAGSADSTDGTGATASFSYPSAVAVSGGYVYVADFNNCTIRKITIATGSVSTFAGIAGNPGSDDTNTASNIQATFDSPAGIANDSAGNIYVADSYNNNIRMITSAGVVTTLAGPVGTAAAGASGSADGTGAAATFDTPNGVVTDGKGNVYVADSGNNIVRKITSGGAVSTLAGKATITGSADGTVVTATFNHPSGVAIDSVGNVYVADQDNSTLRKISTVGNVTTPFGIAGVTGSTDTAQGTPSFKYPADVAVDSSDNIYVADSGNNTIRKITPSGTVSTFAGVAGASGNSDSTDGTGATARFSYPAGIATDSAGNVYVADSNNNAIREIAPSGNVTTLAGGFNNPTSVAVDSAGNAYVADSGNNMIRKIVIATKVVSTLAGTGNAGSDDTTATTVASFNNPTGVTTDGAGNVYVADQYNHTIRKITPTGVVSTVVGVAGQPGFSAGALPGLLSYPVSVTIRGTSLYIVTVGGIAVVKNVP